MLPPAFRVCAVCRRLQELAQQPAIDGFKAGMQLGDQMRAVAEEELVRIPSPDASVHPAR